MEGKKRPIIIGIIGILTILLAILVLIVGAAALFASSIITDNIGSGLEGYVNGVGYAGILAGIIILIIGIAIWRGWSIAWYIAIILYILGVLGSLISIGGVVTGGDINTSLVAPFVVSLLICLLILYYLFRPKVREFFGT